MKNILIIPSLFLFFIGLTFLPACSTDKLEEPTLPTLCDSVTVTYTSHIKAIIDASCAYTGCHDGAVGDGPGNYNNYAGLEGHINSGLLKTRVLDLRNMPPSYATPNELTAEEIELFQCWVDGGYLE